MAMNGSAQGPLPAFLEMQLLAWKEIEDEEEANPEVVIDPLEMNDDMDRFQDQMDAKENLLRFQASSPNSGGWAAAPRLNIPWSTSQYRGDNWEDQAENRAHELPGGVIAGWRYEAPMRMKNLSNEVIQRACLGEIRNGFPLDERNRTIVRATITRCGPKYHTAQCDLGRVYVDLKFTRHIPEVGAGVFMIVGMAEARRSAPFVCVKVLKK
jgi:hypothetical protein